MNTCPACGSRLVEVDNPMRREVRHPRGVTCDGKVPPLPTDFCLREVVVTSDTVADPAWLAATHVLCGRRLPCDNANHKPNAGWASA